MDSNYVNKSKGCQSCVHFTNGILDINDVNVRYYHSHAYKPQVQGISDIKNVNSSLMVCGLITSSEIIFEANIYHLIRYIRH